MADVSDHEEAEINSGIHLLMVIRYGKSDIEIEEVERLTSVLVELPSLALGGTL